MNKELTIKDLKNGMIIIRKMRSTLGITYHYGIITNEGIDNPTFIQHVHSPNSENKNDKKSNLLFMRTTFDEFMNGENDFWVINLKDGDVYYTQNEVIEICKKRENEKIDYNFYYNNCENYIISCRIKGFKGYGNQVKTAIKTIAFLSTLYGIAAYGFLPVTFIWQGIFTLVSLLNKIDEIFTGVDGKLIKIFQEFLKMYDATYTHGVYKK